MARTRGCFLNGEKITCCWNKWPRFVIAAFFPAFPSTVVRGGEYGVVNSEGVGRTVLLSVPLRPRLCPCEVLCVLCFGWTRCCTAVREEITLERSFVSTCVYD